MWNYKCVFIAYILSITVVKATVSDYIINQVKGYFGYNTNEIEDYSKTEIFDQRIPYEVSTTDEKFLTEAAKLTGVALTELDSCQQRVVLRLKSECDKMNDEQLAKMAVHLLNCQSFVEGRQIYPCSDEMSIRECTSSMDSDTWTSYHLMSNRARAVCYTIRQSQFRGLAEHTVNRLMDSARDQLKNLRKISDTQENLQTLAETTYSALTRGHKSIIEQQQDIQKVQFHGQLVIEDNIKRLADEKRLILETHNHLVDMTRHVQDKLENSLQQLQDQSEDSRKNHEELIDDLLLIQNKAKEIFQKIDESSSLLLDQNENLRSQYQSTLKNLQEVNATLNNLVRLVGGTRQVLEERLAWITSALGGTDLAVEKIYLILWHSTFILLSMLTCAFLGATASTRLIVATLPPINLAVALHGEHKHLDCLSLVSAVGFFVVVQTLIVWAMSWAPAAKEPLPSIRSKLTPTKSTVTPANVKNEDWMTKVPVTSTNYSPESRTDSSMHFNDDDDNSMANENLDDYSREFLTPPVSRNTHYSLLSRSRSRSNTPLRLNQSLKSPCSAKTRLGAPCKLSALSGRDFCYRHQTGSSVMS